MPIRVGMVVPANRVALEAAAEGLTGLNFAMLLSAARRGTPIPPIYATATRYRRERPGQENWQTVADLQRTRAGDCEDLSAWRAAELRAQGIPARVRVDRTPRGSYHARVQHPDGTIEDPSLILMRKERSR